MSTSPRPCSAPCRSRPKRSASAAPRSSMPRVSSRRRPSWRRPPRYSPASPSRSSSATCRPCVRSRRSGTPRPFSRSRWICSRRCSAPSAPRSCPRASRQRMPVGTPPRSRFPRPPLYARLGRGDRDGIWDRSTSSWSPNGADLGHQSTQASSRDGAMAHEQEIHVSPAGQPIRAAEPARSLTFGHDNAFQLELRRRVAEHFRTTGRRQRDCWQMYVKTAILLGLFAAEIGFNIQHEGGHQAYSNLPWSNKLMAMTLELIGGSSYLWRWKHVVFHHTYVNITGHDTDIDLGLLARLTPHQKRRRYHRWQHLYLWPLYGLLAIKWQLVDDFRKLISGRISHQPFPRPTDWELVIFVAGKVIFFSVAFGIPLLFHSVGVVLSYYAVAGLVAGMALSVVFQVAHCVEQP